MTSIRVEITQTHRVIATVDIETYCLFWAKERADFDGTNLDFVRESIHEIGHDWIIDRLPYEDEGVEIEAQPDDGDVEMGIYP